MATRTTRELSDVLRRGDVKLSDGFLHVLLDTAHRAGVLQRDVVNFRPHQVAILKAAISGRANSCLTSRRPRALNPLVSRAVSHHPGAHRSRQDGCPVPDPGCA